MKLAVVDWRGRNFADAAYLGDLNEASREKPYFYRDLREFDADSKKNEAEGLVLHIGIDLTQQGLEKLLFKYKIPLAIISTSFDQYENIGDWKETSRIDLRGNINQAFKEFVGYIDALKRKTLEGEMK